MMTQRDIASILLGRKNAALSFILDSASRAKLTPEAFQEALRLGWIVPSPECDYLCVSQDANKLAEMRNAVSAAVEPRPSDPESIVCESKDAILPSLFEAHRAQSDFAPYGLPAELAEVAAVKAPDKVEVGTPVKVASDGRTFTATVQSVRPDGKLVLSFPPNAKPATLKPDYDASEVSYDAGEKPEGPKPVNPTAPDTAASKPAVPVPTVSGGPKAPGLGESGVDKLCK
jgi:hypothetical protein